MMKKLTFTFLILIIFLPLQAAEPYRDESRGVSFEIPSGWRLIPQQDSTLIGLLVENKPTDQIQGKIVVSILEGQLPMPHDKKELKAIVKQVSAPSNQVPNTTDFKVIDSGMNEKIGETNFFYQVSYTSLSADHQTKRAMLSLNYIFTKSGRFFAITLVAPKKTFKDFELVFENFLTSFGTFEIVPPLEKGPPPTKKGK